MAAKTWWYALPLSVAAACGASESGGDGPTKTEATPNDTQAGDSLDHAGLRAAWVAAVQKDAPASYHLSSIGRGGFSALNQAQGISAELTKKGVRVASDSRPNQALDMALKAVGCDGSLEEVSAVEPSASGNRAEYRHDSVVEWYLNGPVGLEQGFDLAAPPACRAAGGKDVTLEIEMAGLSPELSANADAALLRDEKGEVILRYTDLRVVDANGRVLPAKLEAAEASIRIHVDDTGAAYPIVVDPIVWSESQKLVAGDAQADDTFGTAVAIDGDTAVVGAPTDDDKGTDAGAAYVFVRNAATNTWAQTQKLLSGDASGTTGDRFGSSVTISGNLLAVGAPLDQTSRGVLFVFQRAAAGANFTQLQRITAPSPASGDQYGKSLSLSGNTLIVGAPYDDNGNGTDAGSAFIYLKGAATFALQATLTGAPTGAAQDEFGTSVAVSADTAIVGAYGDDDNGSVSGSAYIYFRTGNAWALQAKIAPPDGKANDWFGYSVAVAGDTAIMGAPSALANQGKAYAYLRTAGTWAQQAILLAADGDGGDQFGYSVSVNGNTAVMGARYDEPSTTGSAYVFERNGGAWAQTKKLTGSDAAPSDQYGISVGVSGSWVIVGDPGQDTAASNAGAAYVYTPMNKLDDGQSCMAGNDCMSGFCVDGVCCDTACGGGNGSDCQACNVTGMLGMCMPVAMGTECRGAAGMCDKAEACDGAATACPPDDKVAMGSECRGSTGACDPAEACDGVGNDCPADALSPQGTECRGAMGNCDIAETCDGMSAACPADMVMGAGTQCRASQGACDVAETCDGMMPACPADAKLAAGTECRAAFGGCDVAEACDGASDACPVDAKSPAGTQCRAAMGGCDAAETCDGATGECPVDALQPAGTECRGAKDVCDVPEACDGIALDCPADGFQPDGTACDNGTCQAGMCEGGQGGSGGQGGQGGGSGGSGGQGGEAGQGGSAGEGGSPSTSSGGPLNPSGGGGCDCHVVGTERETPKGLAGLLLALLPLVRRRRGRSARA